VRRQTLRSPQGYHWVNHLRCVARLLAAVSLSGIEQSTHPGLHAGPFTPGLPPRRSKRATRKGQGCGGVVVLLWPYSCKDARAQRGVFTRYTMRSLNRKDGRSGGACSDASPIMDGIT
jgi:hypothetical protein